MGKLKVTEFNINIHGNRKVFYPGEQLSGEVVLIISAPMEMRGIYIECQGKAECHWTEEQGTGDDRHTEHYHGEEKMFEYKVPLLVGREQLTSQGRYVYPFDINLPQMLPSSFKGSLGYIRYELKAQADKHTVKRTFTLNEIKDVNQEKFRQGPGGQKHKEVGFLCCVAGPLDVSASIDRAAYCPGEVILIDANVRNNTSRDMSALKAKLYKKIQYHSTTQTRTITKVVTKIDGPPIPKGEFALWEKQPFGIPATPPTIANRIVEVSYHVEIQVEVPWRYNPSIKMPVTMGTVPFQQTYPVQQQYTFTPEQTVLQANIATAPPPPMNVFGYPDMAPPSYASVVGEAETNIADQDGKMHGNSSYVPVYTFAQSFQGVVPPLSAPPYIQPDNSGEPPAMYPPPKQAPYPPQQAPYPPQDGQQSPFAPGAP